jgi:general secretion pathway protein M
MTLQERLAKLEPRERTMIGVMAAFFVALVLFGGPYWLFSTVSESRDENQAIRDFIDTVNESRGKIEQKRAAQDAVLLRYAKTVPANFIDDAAKSNTVEVADNAKKPDVPRGKKFTEHVQLLHMHKVGLLGLSKMLEKLETGGYPLAVTRLNVKPRAGEQDSYDVELGISTYERKADTGKKDVAPAGSSDKDEEP